jgi:N-acetylglucosamine-6-phosphate deacetylase
MTETLTPPFNISLDLLNAKIPGSPHPQDILIRKGQITEIVPHNSRQQDLSEYTLDVQGDWITLGGYDLQINGALGLAFTELEKKHTQILQKICHFLWQQGVDAFLPTLVTTSVDKIQQSLSTIADFINIQRETFSGNHSPKEAKVLGVHLEGPFLNVEKRGAHPSRFLLPLTIDNVKRVLGKYGDIVKVITLAPELDQRGVVIPYLRDLGIIVSLGHCQATSVQALEAFAQGATMVTHAFNAMPSLHHREPGLLGAAIVQRGILCGLIADGKHVCSTMIDVLLRACQYEKGVFLVSDALAPLGLPDGLYPWDERQIEVKKGTAWLRIDYHTPIEFSTLAGTTLPLLAGAQNLVKWGICHPESAIAMTTISPRQALGISEKPINQSALNLLRWRFNSSLGELTWQRVF